jgi:hypothetical protein
VLCRREAEKLELVRHEQSDMARYAKEVCGVNHVTNLQAILAVCIALFKRALYYLCPFSVTVAYMPGHLVHVRADQQQNQLAVLVLLSSI